MALRTVLEDRFHGNEPLRPGDVRDQYERDRGRIIHSAAFRRLQGKTQVMGAGEGDFHRTRLTHSLECAQIGTGLLDQLTRSRSVPPVMRPWLPTRHLVEAACFAHDLGHPPFGHGGEHALHKGMAPNGGFEGNAQTLRILTRLEKYVNHGWGINPTRRLVLAVLKYPVPYSAFSPELTLRDVAKCYFDDEAPIVDWATSCFGQSDRARLTERDSKEKPKHRTFDSSLMELADDIAYGVHDIEDIVARGLAQPFEVASALEVAFQSVGGSLRLNTGELAAAHVHADLFGSSFRRKQVVSRLVNGFITAVRVADVDGFEHPLLRFRADLPLKHRQLLKSLREMSFALVIRKAQVRQLEFRGEYIVSEIFKVLCSEPSCLIPPGSWRDGAIGGTTARRVCDYVAGMTDAYAERVYKRLFVPGFGSSSDEL